MFGYDHTCTINASANCVYKYIHTLHYNQLDTCIYMIYSWLAMLWKFSLSMSYLNYVPSCIAYYAYYYVCTCVSYASCEMETHPNLMINLHVRIATRLYQSFLRLHPVQSCHSLPSFRLQQVATLFIIESHCTMIHHLIELFHMHKSNMSYHTV